MRPHAGPPLTHTIPHFRILSAFLFPLQMLHFVDGERHKFVEVQIIDDVVPEGAERFQLILSRPSAGVELGINTTGMALSVLFLSNIFYCKQRILYIFHRRIFYFL